MIMSVAPPVQHQPIRGLKRVEFEQLVKQGAFRDERVELVFGQVVAMSPIDPAHIESTSRVDKLLTMALHGRAKVICQGAIAATDDSEPQPDIYVTAEGSYWHELPARAFLVVEVARSSLAYDRGEKAFLYGISKVDEYWIVDHVHGTIEVYRDGDAGQWRSIQTFRRGEVVTMTAFPDVQVAVSDVVPPE
jgi:Uma2 family endonuclease